MPTTRPTVFCVEDSLTYETEILRSLTEPAPGLCEALAAGPFDVIIVRTGEEAERLLREAHRSLCPYDILLLDLELPDRPAAEPSVGIGKDLLRLATGELAGACNAVVVQSVFTEFHHVRDAVRAGAADFVAKPFEDDELFAAVAAAYKRSRERLAHRWLELQRGRRQQWIIAQARNQVADGILSAVTSGLAEVQDQSAAVADALRSQFKYDLERDRDELICQEVNKLGVRTRGVAQACVDARPQLHAQRSLLERICAEDLLSAALTELQVGFTYKQLRLERRQTDQHYVCSFRDELEAIVRELLFNAIDAAPEGSVLTISMQQEFEEGLVALTVADHGELLPPASIEPPATVVGPSYEIDRAWVLSLVMRAAESIGSRLKRSAGREGNVITLQIRSVGDA